MATQEISSLFSESPARVMVVSDDPEVASIWAFCLDQSHLSVITCGMTREAIGVKNEFLPDLVVVDSHSYEEEDIAFCKLFRKETVMPLLLFTSQNDEYYLLKAYDVGVDDVVAQPVSLRLFMAKVRAWLRRAQNIPPSVLDELRLGDFVLNNTRRLVTLPSGKQERLTHLEGRLLYLLMSHPGRSFESSVLVERVWGHPGVGEKTLLKNLVYRLRQKIEDEPSHPKFVLTDGPNGYFFAAYNY